MQVEFPELIARIDALSPALDLAVRAGDVVRVSAIIQQYNDYVDATYIDHMGYAFTPAIAVRLKHLGVLADAMGFDEIADILEYQDAQESEEEDFPELLEMIDGLSPTLTTAVESNNVPQVTAIIQQYDDYVNVTYSDYASYDITPSVERVLKHLAVLAHGHGFHEICTIFEYEDCQLLGVELAD